MPFTFDSEQEVSISMAFTSKELTVNRSGYILVVSQLKESSAISCEEGNFSGEFCLEKEPNGGLCHSHLTTSRK